MRTSELGLDGRSGLEGIGRSPVPMPVPIPTSLSGFALPGAPAGLLRLLARHAGGGILVHSLEVARGAARIGREYGLAPRQLELIGLAGLLHDVGKSLVPRRVLEKPGPLDAHEWRQIRRHPSAGARLLRAQGIHPVAGWVLAHHERPDGHGYPRGLRGEEIPLEARIVAVADAFDAMTGPRAYRAPLNQDMALLELQRAAGEQLDPQAVKAFVVSLPPRTHAA
jgi:putative nucleotidyltransferase with HDIG domain